MKKRLIGIRWFGIVLSVLLIVIAISVAFYFLHVSDQQTYHTARNFRLLGLIGDQLKAKIENYDDVVQNQARNGVTIGQFNKKMELVPNAKLAPGSPVYDASQPIEGISARMDVRHIEGIYWLYIQCEFAQQTGVTLTEEFRVPFSDVIQKELAQNAFDDILIVQNDGAVVFQANASGPAVMTLDSLLPKDTTQKDQVLPTRDRITQDPETKLQSESGQPSESKAVPRRSRNQPGPSRLEIKSQLPKPLAGNAPLPLSYRPAPVVSRGPDLASGVRDVSLADGNYKLFVQPVRIFLNDARRVGPARDQWYVCGLVQSSRFLLDTLVVSYSIRVLVVFLFFVGVLFIPFLRVASVGLADRLHSIDILVLFASVLMSCAVITLFCLGGLRSYASGRDTDEQLANLSTRIATNFRAELLDVSAQLQEMNEAFKKSCPECVKLLEVEGPRVESEPAPQTALYSKPATLTAGSKCRPSKPNILSETGGPYRFFDMVVWVDPNGQQKVKWTIKNTATQFNLVKDRSYFKEVRENRLWSIPTKDNSSRDFALERIVSRNTGEKPTVLSIEGPVKGSVATIDFEPLSLVDTVLPPGFGYCVIDEAGNEAYHSDDFRALRENFFEECDNDRKLRSVVFARIARSISTRYLGSNRRLYVRPLEGPPWTLIVFRDTPVLETVNLEVLTIVTLLSLFNSIPVLIIFVLIYSEDWIWPAPGKARRYSSLAALNLLLCALFGLAILVFHDSVILAGLAVIFPPIGLVITYMVLTRNSVASRLDKIARVFRANSWLPYRTGFTLNTVSLTLLLSVLPSIALFCVAQDFEAKLFLRLNQLKIARTMEARDRRIREKYRDIEVREGAAAGAADRKDELLMSRLSFARSNKQTDGDEYSDVYIKFFLGEEPSWSSPPEETVTVASGSAESQRAAGASGFLLQSKDLSGFLEWVIERVVQLRPLYNQTCVEMHELTRAESGDGLWRSQDFPGKLALYKKPATAPVRLGAPHVLTIGATLPRQHRARWLVIPLVLMLPLYYLIRFLYKRVFFLDAAAAEKPLGPQLGASRISQHLVVIGTRFAGLDKRFRGDAFHTIDLRGTFRQYGSFDKYDWDAIVDKIVVIRHLEDEQHDTALTDEKLNLLERALSYARVVIVATTVDPSHLVFGSSPQGLTTGTGSTEVPENENVEQSRQAVRCKRLLSAFVCVYLDDKAGVNSSSAASSDLTTGESLLGRLISLFSAPAGDADCIAAARRQIEIEMAQSRHLENIGKKLMRDPGSLTREKVIRSFLMQAQPYYDSLWATCSREDRLALFHLAQDHLVACGDPQFQRLQARGLAVLRPNLRLMNDSFAQFVLSVCSPDDVKQWQLLGQRSGWSKLRTPLIVGVVGIAVFVFVTQREVYDYTLTAVSAITIGIPALFKVIGIVRGGTGLKGI